ncbi:MAG: helix-turn-helix domain-containing protein [Planctomycetota bacterium]
MTGNADRIKTPLPSPAKLVLPDPLPTLDQMRDVMIAEALRRSSGNLSAASSILGISRWGLSKRLKNLQ